MKTNLSLLFVALASSAFGATPTSVTLSNGAVLKKVSVVRWEKEVVVLKHAGGVDPIRYDKLSPADRKAFEEERGLGLAMEAEKKAAKGAEGDLAVRVADAIHRRVLVRGMTKAQAVQSWGEPTRINSSERDVGTFEQWVYEDQAKYVYFLNGKLVSWGD